MDGYILRSWGALRRAMDAKDRGELAENKNELCRLEWIAWAIDAARRHKEVEHQDPPESRRSKRVDVVDE